MRGIIIMDFGDKPKEENETVSSDERIDGYLNARNYYNSNRQYVVIFRKLIIIWSFKSTHIIILLTF